MFYYPEERGRKGSNQRGQQRVPQYRFLQDNENLQGWNTRDSNEYLNFGLELITGTQTTEATQAQRVAQQQPQQQSRNRSVSGGSGGNGGREQLLRLSGGDFSDDGAVALSGRLGLGVVPGMDGNLNLAGDRFGTRGPRSGIAQGPLSPSTYGSHSLTVRDNIQAQAQTHSHSPDFTTIPDQYQIFAFPQSQQHYDNDQFNSSNWHNHNHNLTTRALPPSLPHSHLVSRPAIQLRVTDTSGASAAPLTFAAAYEDLQQVYSPQAPHHPNSYINNRNFSLPSQQLYADNMGHGRNDSVNDTTNFPTPVSMPPAESHSPLISPLDNRRPSSVSSFGHRRNQSTCSSIDGDEDGASPGHRNHSYKRSEEPPRNEDGKMICKHQECTGSSTTFDRKCEWSKHMDKHERPYKCTVKGCEKLQGFTYSGGLLRHEREVHKMHGGTKKSLFCPFADCKRSSGSGFTRKENLAEHVRRVHRRTSMSSDLGHLIVRRADTFDEEPVRMSPEVGYPPILEAQEEAPFSHKRKRSEAGLSESEDVDLRAEVKRLRNALEEKDSRLQQLETVVMQLQRQSQSQSQSQSQR